MTIAQKLFQVLLGGIFIYICLNSQLLAAEPPVLFLSDESKPKNEIDWSKPIVSRGFGYEAQVESDKLFEADYKSGQVAYFFGEFEKAFDIWFKLAEKNHTESQASLAWLYHAGLGVEKNLQKAFELYQKAATKNNAVAQNNLGTMYENGVYVESDREKAKRLYKLSAENGYRFGQYNYANALLEGWGAEPDKKSAREWYQKAADQDVKQAKDKLTSMKE